MAITDEFVYVPALDARANDVSAKLAALVEEGILKRSALGGRILDIGSGYGGSYKALSRYSPDVIGIEPKKKLVEQLIRHGIIDKNKIFATDALQFLKGQPDTSYDFICALHLFNNGYGLDVERVHEQAFRTLRKGGQILYTAEMDTSSGPNFSRRLEELAGKNTATLIRDFRVGPDNVVYVQTKV